jgi:hypothetical protein
MSKIDYASRKIQSYREQQRYAVKKWKSYCRNREYARLAGIVSDYIRYDEKMRELEIEYDITDLVVNL